MRDNFVPWINLVLARARPYHRAAWFVGAIEREHRSNLAALPDCWVRTYMTLLDPPPFPTNGPFATQRAHEGGPQVHASHLQRLSASLRVQRSRRASRTPQLAENRQGRKQ